MQIIVSRADLLTALKRASAAVVVGQLTFQACVLIDAGLKRKNGGVIAAQSGMLRVECECACEVKTPGQALLNHRRLQSLATECPVGNIEITVAHDLKVSVRSLASKRKFQMTAHETELWPPIPPAGGEPVCVVEAKILQQTGSEVSFCIDKAYTDGALLAPIEGGKFHLVSFSSRGMALATGWFHQGAEGQRGREILIPNALLEAAGVLTGDSTPLEIKADDRRVTLSAPDTQISCDLLAQSFPGVWAQVHASQPTHRRFRVPAQRFLESVKAVSVAADVVEGTERFIQIDLRYAEGECVVATRKSAISFGEDEMSILDPSEGSFTVHLEGSQLTHALRSFGPDDVDLFYDVVGGQQAFVLKSESLFVMMMPVSDTKAKA